MGKLGGKLSMQVKKLKHKPWLSYCMLSSLVWLLTIFAMPAYSASKTVLVLGDSLSAEYGLARGKGWVSLLENQLLSAKINAKVINASISGETTAGGKTRLAALLQQHKPTILIIELGGNDGLRGLALKTTEANLRDMIKQASASKAQVLLLGMQIPPNYGTAYSKQFAEIFTAVGKEKNVKLVRFFLAGLEDTEKFFQADHIHPNELAQSILLANIWPSLQSLIK
jgi:acyl-CoA thioesterase I